jgi:4-amino-4-deoxy-L-arabinose transferase-like glycosyltransferase
MARLRFALRRLAALPDGSALTLVILVAAAVRLMFLFRAPPLYVGGDSPTYLDPALALLSGEGFDPIVKRPPGYPLFLAAGLAYFGLDLQGVNFAQHLLGVVTAAATWALGRLTFGRPAGLLAGLLIAINGTLLIYEHYIMAETLFTCLLAVALAATVLAARRPRAWLLVVTGLLFGLASATRQSGQVLIGLVPLALLLAGADWRGALRGLGLALVGFATVVIPWLAFDYARHQALASGTLGETLVWRLSRSGAEVSFFKWKLPADPDPRRQEARRFAFEQAADRILPSDTKVALQRRFGLNEADSDAVLRAIALESIGQHTGQYLGSSFALLVDHLRGDEQWLGGQGKEGGRTRYSDVLSKYQDWWSERTQPLIQNASPAQETEFRRAQAIAGWFQPYRFSWLLVPLTLAGVLAALVSGQRRLGLVPAAAALILLSMAALLAGDLPRYRYPAEPALAVLQAGGLLWLVALAGSLPRRAGLRAALGRSTEPSGGRRLSSSA